MRVLQHSFVRAHAAIHSASLVANGGDAGGAGGGCIGGGGKDGGSGDEGATGRGAVGGEVGAAVDEAVGQGPSAARRR